MQTKSVRSRMWPFAFAVVVALAPALARGAELHAGAATADITPPTGYPMWGYGARHDAPSEGVLDRLLARAVVLRAGETKVAVVSLDLGRAPTRDSTAAIARRLKKEAGIEHFFLVASHTHHGPVLELDNWPAKGKPYVRELEDRLVEVILAAHQNARPARYGVAAKETSLNRNRHSRLTERPVDRELIVLRLEDGNAKPIAHLVNFAAHPTMHPVKLHRFSADYPGAMARLVEKETGAPCLFLQGAAGDLSPNAGDAKGPQEFGERLGKEVLVLARTIRCDGGRDATLRAVERQFRFGMRVDLSNPLVLSAYRLAFFKELIDFYEREYRDGLRPRLTTAVLDGKVGFVGVSGEFFCGHALSLKKRARLEHLLFLGYCNDYQQYFPTIEAIAEGGYGADPAVAPAEVGAGEQMMNRALVELYQLRGKVRVERIRK